MQKQPTQLLANDIRAALAQSLIGDDESHLSAVLAGRHPAELVDAFGEITLEEALAVFGQLDDIRAAELLDELDPETVRYITTHAPPERIADLLDHLPMDDAAEIVSEAHPDRAETLIAELQKQAPEDAAEVRRLLAYPDDTAGRLMTDKFASVGPDMTASEVMDYVRRHASVLETINELYIVDDGRMLGVATIAAVITAEPDVPIRSFMTADPISVPPTIDQKEVARLISRYDLLTLPVTDTDGRMLGIVTIDDTIDVLVEEFNEEYLRSVGSDAEELERKTPAQVAWLRMPWIMATLFIELLAGVMIHVFDGTLRSCILLASFMPIISAISGNTGLQSAAIIIRGLSSGQVQLSGWRHALSRQVATTMILGGSCAIVLGAIGAIWQKQWSFGLVVFLGMFVAVNIAGVVGTCVPMISKRMGFDPALTAGPFETAFQDVIGISIFLGLATWLLHVLR